MSTQADRVLASSTQVLGAAVWASALLFGVYILIYYVFAVFTDDLARWNVTLPALHVPNRPTGNMGMALHFAGGGLLLVLGSVQFLRTLRDRLPALHHWLGRIYVVAAFAAAIGGLVFIAVRGCVGGLVMDVGFGLYGLLMLLAAVQTGRHAMARRIDDHQAWAVRLFALAIGSWLYRMHYGFWFLFTDGIGHNATFTGWFDRIMDFGFYLPNLIVAEVWLRASRNGTSWGTSAKAVTAMSMWVATCFVVVATWFFAIQLWLPRIGEALSWR